MYFRICTTACNACSPSFPRLQDGKSGQAIALLASGQEVGVEVKKETKPVKVRGLELANLSGSHSGGLGGDGGVLTTRGGSTMTGPTTSTGAASSAGQLFSSSQVPHHAALGQGAGGGASFTGTPFGQPQMSVSGASVLQPTHAPTVGSSGLQLGHIAAVPRSTSQQPALTGITFGGFTRPQPAVQAAPIVRSQPAVQAALTMPQFGILHVPPLPDLAALSSPIVATAPDRPVFTIADVLCRATL